MFLVLQFSGPNSISSSNEAQENQRKILNQLPDNVIENL